MGWVGGIMGWVKRRETRCTGVKMAVAGVAVKFGVNTCSLGDTSDTTLW